MEQAFADANNPMFKARRILEINPKHDLFARLQKVWTRQRKYCIQRLLLTLYAQALLIEGMMPEDPAAIANKIAELMAR